MMKFSAEEPAEKCTCGSTEFVSLESIVRGYVFNQENFGFTGDEVEPNICDSERISWTCRKCDKEIVEGNDEDLTEQNKLVDITEEVKKVI
jgi:hypothetical protein